MVLTCRVRWTRVTWGALCVFGATLWWLHYNTPATTTHDIEDLLNHGADDIDTNDPMRLDLVMKRWSHRKHEQLRVREDVVELTDVLMRGTWTWHWMRTRICQLWPQWVSAARNLSSQPYSHGRLARRILIMPGVLTKTDFATPHRIQQGGPLGELAQWADLIAGLYVTGHNLTLQQDLRLAEEGLRLLLYHTNKSREEGCHSPAIDLIYTDRSGALSLSQEVLTAFKKKLRVLDVFGTEASYNNQRYASSHRMWHSGGLTDLNLKQYYTMYPESPDNSFLGFAVSSETSVSSKKEKTALLYGKEGTYIQGKLDLLSTLSEYVTLHATLPLEMNRYLPPHTENHGVVSSQDFQQVARNAKVAAGQIKTDDRLVPHNYRAVTT